ncbi:MAG: UDP-N-acetylmuramoyl-tripeptide--D-alanyl-D-alanine ligase, partial [Rhodothermales bacterium]|nr:UDP-N-acetylmuramoyl-tripeptide--D-alanyl-D-alanine ligase [Rhodothermales bacterium]
MTLLVITAVTLASVMALWRIGRRGLFFLHILQLQGYKTPAYAGWLSEHLRDAVLRRSHLAGGLLLTGAMAAAVTTGDDSGGVTIALGLLWAVAFASSRRYRREKTKKPYAATPRMKRLLAAAATMAILIVAAGAALWARGSGPAPVLWYFGALLIADLTAPLLVRVAAGITSPVERRIHEGFKRLARARLAARTDLTTIAITGSYGKTSTKFAVRDVLSQRYSVLATPGSFNTPMGICRVVNNRLRGDHRYLVLEMGIRNPGDIAELCDIARPDIAVITSVGVAHLESMGSIEAIAREKGSLLEFLKPGGVAVLNIDDERVRA